MTEIPCRGYAGNIPVYCSHDKIVPLEELKPNPKNPNRHPGDQVELLAKVIEAQGWRQPVKVSTRSGFIVSGHGRYEAALLLGCPLPVDFQSYHTDEDELADLLADNRIAELAEMDEKLLAEIFSELDAGGYAMDATGFRDDEISRAIGKSILKDPDQDEPSPSLSDRFVFPPTSVLYARCGEWTNRKTEWIGIGINSELGREKGLTYKSVAIADPTFYDKKKEKELELGRTLTTKEFTENYYDPGNRTDNSTSIFDPVLCELCYKWFSGDGGRVLDPFSGGSVRGIVAALTGRKYTGIDLRPEQIEANREQWKKIRGRYQNAEVPNWITGDSTDVLPELDGKYDFLFSCPPYADLEVYSDDPADLSNMEYSDFLTAYRNIIRLAVDRLENDRFAAFVVGEVRDKNGHYRNFVGDTIAAFVDAGMKYYNEAILVTNISGLRFRAGRTFEHSRKLSKTHQNVLVFVKGDPKKATEHCGDISAEMPLEYVEEGSENGEI